VIMLSEETGRHLEPADERQIRLLMRLPPERRLQTLLAMQTLWLDNVRARLRRAYPQLSNYELTLLMFERLQHG